MIGTETIMTTQMDPRALARKHLDRRFATVASDAFARPSTGWLRAIRDALGMTTRQAAQRAGIHQSTYSRFEKSEADDSITLASLRSAAEALGCTLVYAVVPNQPLDEMVRNRARLLASEQLAQIGHTMRLEDQALTKETLAAERERLAEDILRDSPRRLWDSE